MNLTRFNSEKTVSFVPPDGEFELMKYVCKLESAKYSYTLHHRLLVEIYSNVKHENKKIDKIIKREKEKW